jgi:hypothetical protein
MPSLVDQFCPNVHDAAITAAAYDPDSGTLATADASGMVAVQRPGEATPGLVFHPGGPVSGALCVIRGGSLIAVGDDEGSVGVYRTDNGEAIWEDRRDGARGKVRAMRGVALASHGGMLAAIAKDGLLRVWSLQRDDRNAWRGFGGVSVEFDPRGERLLAMDEDGQPRMMDLISLQAIYMDKLQTAADFARFTPDGTHIVAAGQAGISVLRVYDGAMVTSFATRGGSGITGLVLSPEGDRCGAVSQRSVHLFSLPDLQPVDSKKHGAPGATGAAIWSTQGVRVAGNDGLLHAGGTGSAGPVTVVGGFGDCRLAAHGNTLAVWKKNRRQAELPLDAAPRELHVDRDGRLAVSVPRTGPIEVWSLETGKKTFDGGIETSGCTEVGIGGTIVAAQLKAGGVRWWDLGRGTGLELKWPTAMALSNGGTWLGVVTPKGAVKILDPATGTDAVPPPVPLADVPIVLMTFVNRRPDLIVLDRDGVLGRYDLSTSARTNKPAEGVDILTINVPVDRMWGITGGQYCALRLPDGDHCSILFVDIHACEVVHEVSGLARHAWVDAENGLILEPGRASALVERERNGEERAVLRALPDGEWISFGRRGILDASANAGGAMG